MTIFGRRQSAEKPARRAGAMTRLLRSIAARLRTETASDETVDLAEFPELLDEKKVSTFYEACLEVFPGQRDICLPLGMEDRVLKCQLPVRAELQLIKRLRRARRVILSMRSQPGKNAGSHPSIVLHFV
ncbi:MAG: hypothetical protein IJG70_05825 [Kiritimatiellae bacterium]|nr:hypothetical protein [Kiritimatiellia bacterium]